MKRFSLIALNNNNVSTYGSYLGTLLRKFYLQRSSRTLLFRLKSRRKFTCLTQLFSAKQSPVQSPEPTLQDPENFQGSDQKALRSKWIQFRTFPQKLDRQPQQQQKKKKESLTSLNSANVSWMRYAFDKTRLPLKDQKRWLRILVEKWERKREWQRERDGVRTRERECLW